MASKAYFTPELFQFLRQLKRNNKREWFMKNRERYEADVRQPCLRFITDFGFHLRHISTWLVADSKPNGGSLFRIYRDVRFSRDKSPYKTHVGMHFRHAGSKENVHGASLYLHLEPGASFLAGGCWLPDARSLAKIRDAIAWKAEDWRAATRKLEFGGDKLSRPPRGYSVDHPMIEDLKRKDFVASVDFADDVVCSRGFMNEVVAGCKKLSPVVGFLSRSLGLQF
jgi:uncharacterized protein (TIGR02453 family)